MLISRFRGLSASMFLFFYRAKTKKRSIFSLFFDDLLKKYKQTYLNRWACNALWGTYKVSHRHILMISKSQKRNPSIVRFEVNLSTQITLIFYKITMGYRVSTATEKFKHPCLKKEINLNLCQKVWNLQNYTWYWL